MKFLLDVHISKAIASALQSDGHDVVRAALEFRTTEDVELLTLASEQERVLITEDRDFSELIFSDGELPPPALVYIRCEPEQQGEITELVLNMIDSPKLIGHLVVISPEKIRFRLFPKVVAND